MTFDQMDRLVRTANPVPDPSALDAGSPRAFEEGSWRSEPSP
jgi:hypothetical protein